ncbi:MAG: MATE family efflux transporter, partial [Eubacteriales bacterium]|nr:MATE family efflux transporter [Eubacteriales bacterium]
MLDGIFKKQSNIRIIVSITSSISMIIDNIFISRFIGMDGVAAAGLITPVLMIILAFSGVLSSGGQLIVGPKMGAGEKDKAIGSVSLCFMLVFISSVIVISGAFLFTDGICAFLGAEPGSELMSMAGEYLKGYMIGTPGIIGMLAIVPLLNIDGDKKRSYVSAWAVTISDIVLDIVAVIVFPGSIGAIALATAISYLLGLIIISGHFIKKDNRYGLRIRFNNIPWGETRDVFSLGFPAALQKVLRTMLTFTINQILLFVGGSIALAGFSIVSNIGNLMNSVGQGLSAATLTISGVLHGERIKKSLKDLYRAFIKYSVLWNLVMVIITILGAEVLVGIYLSAKKVDVTAVIMGVRLFSFDYIFYSLCLCAKNYYLGIKQMKVNYII